MEKYKEVVVLTGAGQIGMAIARRVSFGKKLLIGDKNSENAAAIAAIMNAAGFDAEATTMDLSSRASIQQFIAHGQTFGAITQFINSAGVSPSQAPADVVLKVDLYGTAVLLEEMGKAIAPGGAGVTISSQSGHRMPALSPEIDEQLALTPADDLLNLAVLQPDAIRDSLHAYQMAKRCNVKRVMAEAVKWGARGLIPFRQALSSRRWRWTNSMVHGGIFIKTCSPNALPGAPAQPMKSPVSLSY